MIILIVLIKEIDEILHLSILNSETIDTTTNHVFYVEVENWRIIKEILTLSIK